MLSFAVPEDSETDYSDLENEEVVVVEVMAQNMAATKKRLLTREEKIDQEIEKELSAVLRTATSNSPVLLGCLKRQEVVSIQRKHAPPTHAVKVSRQRSLRGNGDVRYHSNGTAKIPQPVPTQKMDGQRHSSSSSVVSTIHKVLGRKSTMDDLASISKQTSFSEPEEGGVTTENTAKTNHGTVVSRSVSLKLRSSSDCVRRSKVRSSYNPSYNCSEFGGVAKTRAMFEKMSSDQFLNLSPISKGNKSEIFSKDRHHSKGVSNDALSSKRTDDSLTPVLDRKVWDELDLHPPHVKKSGKTLKNPPEALEKKIDISKLGWNFQGSKFLDDSSIDDQGESIDDIKDIHSFSMVDVRARTNTLSALPVRGTSKVEMGRKKIKELRKQMKRASSIADPNPVDKGEAVSKVERISMKVELELLSPLLATKIKNMTLRLIYSEYGGKDIVSHAVAVLEEAWRSYKLRKHFQERLCEMRENRTMQRKRAQTMQRVPSIMGYRRPKKMKDIRSSMRAGAVRNVMLDSMARSKEMAGLFPKDKLPFLFPGCIPETAEKDQDGVSLKSVDEDEGEETVEEVGTPGAVDTPVGLLLSVYT